MGNIVTVKTEEMQPLFGGLYFISDDGKLYSIRSGKFLKPAHDRYGYLYYVISINGKRMTLKAHRLVAKAFIPNPENKPTVNHRNGIRHDNRIANLEWATEKEQAHDPLTRANFLQVVADTDYRAMGAVRNFGRKKTAVYKDGELLGIYDSLKMAANAHHTNCAKASECANGNRKMTGGVQFCYV